MFLYAILSTLYNHKNLKKENLKGLVLICINA